MPTIVDSLIVQLGLDPSGFETGRKKAVADFLKTKEEVAKQAKEIEAAGKRAAEFFSRLRDEALKFFAVIVGATAIEQFVAKLQAADMAAWRLGQTLGISGRTLSEWGGAAERFGGTVAGVDSSFQSLADSIQELKNTGQTGILPFLYRLQAAGGKQIDLNRSLDQTWIDIADNLHQIAQTDPQRASWLARQLGADPGMIPLLLQGGEAIRRILEDQKKLAPTQRDLDAAAERTQDWVLLSQTFTKVGRSILTDLTPAIDQALAGMRQWLVANQGWIETSIAGDLKALVGWIRDFAAGVDDVVKSLGGWQRVTEAIFAYWIGSKVAVLLANLALIRVGLFGIRDAEIAAGLAFSSFAAPIAALAAILGIAPSAVAALNNYLGIDRSQVGLHNPKNNATGALEGGAFWDPNAPVGRHRPGAWWTAARQQHAIDILTAGGISQLGAQALVARWRDVEASRGPGSVNPGSGAFGIGQWLGARKAGISGNTDFDAQLAYVVRELSTTEGRAKAILNSAKTPWDAARGTSAYERAEGYDSQSGTDAYTARVAAAIAQAQGARVPSVMTGAAGAAASITNNRVAHSASMHIGAIYVSSMATDANGIARDLGKALKNQSLALQANYGPS